MAGHGVKCKVCNHPSRDTIELALIMRDLSYREMARRFGVNESSLERHRVNHMRLVAQPPPTPEWVDEEDRAIFKGLEKQVRELLEATAKNPELSGFDALRIQILLSGLRVVWRHEARAQDLADGGRASLAADERALKATDMLSRIAARLLPPVSLGTAAAVAGAVARHRAEEDVVYGRRSVAQVLVDGDEGRARRADEGGDEGEDEGSRAGAGPDAVATFAEQLAVAKEEAAKPRLRTGNRTPPPPPVPCALRPGHRALKSNRS